MQSLLPSLWGHRDKPEKSQIGTLHREVDRLFDEFARDFGDFGLARTGNGEGLLAPSIDVAETEKAIEVKAELPGVDEKDIEVELANGVLAIKGEKKSESDKTEKDFRLIERSYGRFERHLPIPFEIEADKVQASFDKGVLSVTLPKPAEARSKSRKVKIKS